MKGKIVLRVSDGQIYSEEKALHIVVIPKHSPFLRKHESLLAFLDNETTIGPQQVDIGVDSLEETVTITLLQGKFSVWVSIKYHFKTVIQMIYRVFIIYNFIFLHGCCRTKSWTNCEQRSQCPCVRGHSEGLDQ